jgi:hypothetical protein
LDVYYSGVVGLISGAAFVALAAAQLVLGWTLVPERAPTTSLPFGTPGGPVLCPVAAIP